MKTTLALVSLTFFLSTTAFAKIVVNNNNFFVEGSGSRKPIALLNSMVQKKEISQLRLFSGGKVNLVSFSKGGEKEKIYSVDKEGYLYSIRPFTNYEVKDVTKEGMVTFKEEPSRRYRINAKGFFLY